MVSQGRKDFQGHPEDRSGAKNTISLGKKRDDSQSHLFETQHEKDSLQNVDTNQVNLSTGKAAVKTDKNDASEFADVQGSHGQSNPSEVEKMDDEAMQHSAGNVASPHLQASDKRRNMTSENQMLLSGVQTIPEQLPLILTEGDAEEHESLKITAGSEQLQGVSTQAVLGNNTSTNPTGVMVFSSSTIVPSGHIIPIGGASLLVLQTLDGQSQVYQPNSGTMIVQPASQKEGIQTSEEKSQNKEYKCPERGCSKVAPTSSKLKLHMLSHTGERPHKCPQSGCDWAFTTAYKLKRHLRGHTGEKPFICEINNCGKTFTTSYNLKTHQRAHVREQNNVCSHPGCGLSFTTVHRLRVHEKKHIVTREMHACTFEGCEKQFKSLASYNAHVKTHTNEQPHPCTYEGCGKRFAKASKLKLHIRTHTGERPYACEVEGCKWAFTSAYKLKRHSRKHSGERPFVCQYAGCGKAFTRASHMRTHQMSHTGQKPYVCTYPNCQKGFTAASTLTIHLRKHSGDKPFKCTIEGCNKAYTTGANLRLHQKRHEKISSQDESMEQENPEDQPTSIHFLEIGGVGSLVATSPSSAPHTPYSVMHTFSGDFASEDVASLTVVHYSTEETFPPQTPASDNNSHGMCFPFSASDTYVTTSHSQVVFTTATPLSSPGAHYVEGSVEVEQPEEIGTEDVPRNGEHVDTESYVIEAKEGSVSDEYIVRETHTGENIVAERNIVGERNNITEGHILPEETPHEDGYTVGRENSGSEVYNIIHEDAVNEGSYNVREPTSPTDGYIVNERESLSPEGYVERHSQTQTRDYITRGPSSEGNKSSDDMTLPTMVMITSPNSPLATAEVTDVRTSGNRSGSLGGSHGALTLRQRSESTSIDRFAPPAIIFQGEEMKQSEVDTKLHPNSPTESHHSSVGDSRGSNRTIAVSSFNLALTEDIDKSPVSPFIADADELHLDHESTINLQDFIR